jgi:hypothetical protein
MTKTTSAKNNLTLHQSAPQVLSPVDDEDVEVAISEVLALMPRGTCIEDQGAFVRKELYKCGYRIVREE